MLRVLPWVLFAASLIVNALFIGGALFGHGTLTATMQRAPRSQAGLAIGAWGAVQATAVGIGMAMSGAIRDVVNLAGDATSGVWGLGENANGYFTVYAIEIALLVVTLIAVAPLMRKGLAPVKVRGDEGTSAMDVTVADSDHPQRAV